MFRIKRNCLYFNGEILTSVYKTNNKKIMSISIDIYELVMCFDENGFTKMQTTCLFFRDTITLLNDDQLNVLYRTRDSIVAGIIDEELFREYMEIIDLMKKAYIYAITYIYDVKDVDPNDISTEITYHKIHRDGEYLRSTYNKLILTDELWNLYGDLDIHELCTMMCSAVMRKFNNPNFIPAKSARN